MNSWVLRWKRTAARQRTIVVLEGSIEQGLPLFYGHINQQTMLHQLAAGFFVISDLIKSRLVSHKQDHISWLHRWTLYIADYKKHMPARYNFIGTPYLHNAAAEGVNNGYGKAQNITSTQWEGYGKAQHITSTQCKNFIVKISSNSMVFLFKAYYGIRQTIRQYFIL